MFQGRPHDRSVSRFDTILACDGEQSINGTPRPRGDKIDSSSLKHVQMLSGNSKNNSPNT